MSLEGVIYLVRLLEISMEDVGLSKSGRIAWPPSTGDQVMPTVDGVLMLYDVTESKTAAGFPSVLSKFCRYIPDTHFRGRSSSFLTTLRPLYRVFALIPLLFHFLSGSPLYPFKCHWHVLLLFLHRIIIGFCSTALVPACLMLPSTSSCACKSVYLGMQ